MDGGHDIVISQRFGCFLGYGGSAELVTNDNYQKIPLRRVRNVFGIDAHVPGSKKEAKELASFLNAQVGMVAEDEGEPVGVPSADQRSRNEEGEDLFGDHSRL